MAELARGKYAGFNDTHLHEKLTGSEKLSLSRSSVHRILRRHKIQAPSTKPKAFASILIQSGSGRHEPPRTCQCEFFLEIARHIIQWRMIRGSEYLSKIYGHCCMKRLFRGPRRQLPLAQVGKIAEYHLPVG